MKNALIDQPGFLDSGNYFDRVPKARCCPIDKVRGSMQITQRVGANDPNRVRMNIPDSLTESPQTFQRHLLTAFVQPVPVVQTRGQPDPFPQAIDDFRLPVRQAAYDHMKTVRTQIYGR